MHTILPGINIWIKLQRHFNKTNIIKGIKKEEAMKIMCSKCFCGNVRIFVVGMCSLIGFVVQVRCL